MRAKLIATLNSGAGGTVSITENASPAIQDNEVVLMFIPDDVIGTATLEDDPNGDGTYTTVTDIDGNNVTSDANSPRLFTCRLNTGAQFSNGVTAGNLYVYAIG